MKRKSFNSTKSNSFDSQFQSLNNNEMTNLKGGTNPPLPPGGGDDYPIDLTKLNTKTVSYNSRQPLPKL